MPPEPPAVADLQQENSEQAQAEGKNKGIEKEGSFLRRERGTGHCGSGQLVQGVSQTPDLYELKWVPRPVQK